jgi:dolichyl-phosphate beta-glucosyltransferase
VAALQRGADVAIACRVLPESEYVMPSRYLRYLYTRHLLSRAFNKLVRFALLPGVLDTQAGLKGYTACAARKVFSRMTIAGFGFDLECLFVARQLTLRIEQIPVRFRYHDEPSTVNFVRDAGTMAADLARIRWRGWIGEYGSALRELADIDVTQPGDALSLPPRAREQGIAVG